ncbi:MAG: asparaginase [Ruminococcus sp.]|nr:asparaginase [Ruminococcus sp.]
MKILLFTTGGTIASIIDDGVIDVTPQGKLLVLKKYAEIDKETQFEVVSPINILSENVRLSDYKTIIDEFRRIDFSLYDGVIVTHGSDTLAYTSALLGLLFSDINKPVCVVAADKSLQDEKSNGMDNFIAGVELIRQGINGVYVPYRNSDSVVYIHRAVELFESDTLSDDFYSLDGAFAVYRNGVIEKREGKSANTHSVCIDKADLSFTKKIMQVMPYPDLDYSKIDVSGFDCVLHRTYHAGSVCAVGNSDNCITTLIDKCKAEGVPLYVCGLKSGKANYYSMSSVLDKGIMPLYDMAPPCAYMKLMLEG